jgi:hypothetical protein
MHKVIVNVDWKENSSRLENSPNLRDFVADIFTEKNHFIEHMYKCNKVKQTQ